MNLNQVLQSQDEAITTGSQGRTNPVAPDYAGAMKVGVDLLQNKMSVEYQRNANSFLANFAQQEGAAVEAFLLDEKNSQLDNILGNMQTSGVPVDDGTRESLQGAMDVRKKIELMKQQGKGEAALALVRRRFLTNAIAQRPDLAKEIIQVVNAGNSLTDKAADMLKLSETSKFKMAEDQVKFQSGELVKRGFSVIGLNQTQIVEMFEKEVGSKVRRINAADAALKELQTRRDIGEAERRIERDNIFFDSIDAVVSNTGAALGDIVTNQSIQPEQRLQQVATVRAQLQQRIASSFRGASQQEIQDKFGQVFDMLKVAEQLADPKLEEGKARRLKAQLEAYQASAGINTMQQAGPLAQTIVGIQQGLGIKLSEYLPQEIAFKVLSPFRNSLMQTAVDIKTGKAPASGLQALGSRPTGEQVREYTQGLSAGLEGMAKAPDLSADEVKVLAGNVSAFLKDPYHKKSLDAFDQLVPTLANKQVVDTLRRDADFFPDLQKDGQQKLTQYMSSLTASVATEVQQSGRKLELNSEGLPVFTGQPDTKMLKVQTRMQNTIKAYAHLRGIDYQRATQEFAQVK